VGLSGTEWVNALRLGAPYQLKVDSLLELIDHFSAEIERFDTIVDDWLADDAGYRAVQHIPGVGPTFASIFVAEIGDVRRFPNPETLCSWAGMRPKHRESDTKVRRGHVTKQGSPLVRWAAVESVARARGTIKLRADYQRIAERRGRNIAKVAAGRRLLTLVYYGLRDGHIRALAKAQAG
jgi:transposase